MTLRAPYRSLNSETLGKAALRVRKEGSRKPARTVTELAEEFGVKRQALVNLLRADPNAPKPLFRTGGPTTSSSTWYDYQAARRWWRARIPAQVPDRPALNPLKES